MSQNPNFNTGQDPNQQAQYGSGYSGYSAQSNPNASYTSSQYDAQGGYQQQQQQYSGSSGPQQQQQQYGTYQPPLSASRGKTASDPTSTGMNARTEAALSYVLIWVSGLLVFFLERKNRFVRFHAAQSFLFFGTISVILGILKFIMAIPFLGAILSLILSPLSFIIFAFGFLVWLFLIFMAYRGANVRLPFFANYADSLVARFTRK